MNRLKLIIIGFLLAGMAAIVWGTVTQEYSSGAVSGRPLTVKKAVVTWDNTEGDYTNMNAGDEELDKDIFGYIERNNQVHNRLKCGYCIYHFITWRGRLCDFY